MKIVSIIVFLTVICNVNYAGGKCITVYNPFMRAWKGNVRVDLSKLKLCKAMPCSIIFKDSKNKILLSQTDDLDFDGIADEAVVRMSLKAGEIKVLQLAIADKRTEEKAFAVLKDSKLISQGFEIQFTPDGLMKNFELKKDGQSSKIFNSTNLCVWLNMNRGWEQKNSKLKIYKSAGPLRAVYYMKGLMNSKGISKGKMLLKRKLLIYSDREIESEVLIDYLKGPVVLCTNKQGGIRSIIECDIKKMYRTLSWDLVNKLKTADMKRAWHHMRGVAGGVAGGFLNPASGYGVISLPDRKNSALRLWDNRTDPIANAPKGQALLLNELGWWGERVQPGKKIKSGWRIYVFKNKKEAQLQAVDMIETPLLSYSAEKLKNKISKLYAAKLKTFPESLSCKYQSQISDAVTTAVKNYKNYWKSIEKRCSQLEARCKSVKKTAYTPVLICVEKFKIYNYFAELCRKTSDWNRYFKMRDKALKYYRNAMTYLKTIDKEHPFVLNLPLRNEDVIGFFGGDPAPLCENLWTEIVQKLGMKDYHPIYFTRTATDKLRPVKKNHWDNLIKLHKKYKSKFVICLQISRRLKPASIKKQREWVWKTKKGKNLKSWAGYYLSAVSPDLYGSVPVWMDFARKNTESALYKLLEDCKKANIKPEKLIKGFAVENEPVFVYDYNPHVIKAYHNWLKKKFKTIKEFNKQCGSSYVSFKKIEAPALKKRFLKPAEWIEFNLFRLDNQAAYIKWQADIVKKIIPSIPIITKPNCSVGTHASIQRGNDSWRMGWSQIGFTGVNAYCDSTDFNSYFPPHIDMVRSGGNDQKLWLTEFGFGRPPFTGPSKSNLIPPKRAKEIIYTMKLAGIQKIYCYHLKAGQTNPTFYLKGDLLPTESLMALARVQVELNNLDLFDKCVIKPEVAIYYSRLSAIMSKPDPYDDTIAAHALLKHMNFKIDYIDDEQIINAKLKRYKLLYIQPSPYINSAIISKLKNFVKAGGVLLVEGNTGIYNQYAKKYKGIPLGANELFGSQMVKNTQKDDMSFEDTLLKVKGQKAFFKINEPEYYLKNTKAKIILKDSENNKILATLNKYGKGKVLLFSFPLAKEYKRELFDESSVVGSVKSSFDKVGGIFSKGKKIYKEPLQLPASGAWLYDTLKFCKVKPAVSRKEKDIEARIYFDKNIPKYIVVINHRNRKINTRLEISSELFKEYSRFYDVFNIEQFRTRNIANSSVLRLKMKPYQVRILIPGKEK